VAVVASFTVRAEIIFVKLATLLSFVAPICAVLVKFLEEFVSLQAELLLTMGELAQLTVAAAALVQPVLAKLFLVLVVVGVLQVFTGAELQTLFGIIILRGKSGLIRSERRHEVCSHSGGGEASLAERRLLHLGSESGLVLVGGLKARDE